MANPPPNDIQAQIKAANYLARTQFRYYVQRVFCTLNPNIVYEDNWHLDYMCWMLQRTMPAPFNPTPNEPIRRLIINVPPRSLKSLIATTAFTTFLHGHLPHLKFITGSYSSGLSGLLMGDARKVIESNWYKTIFPLYKDGPTNSAKRYDNTTGGYRAATSTGGTITGFGGDYIIADDLLNPEEAKYKVQREAVNEWFDGTLSTRLNDLRKGVIIVIMQRLAPGDLTDHLLEKNKHLEPEDRWQHISLPIVNFKDQEYTYYQNKKLWLKGESLHNVRYNRKEIRKLLVEKGSYVFAGQFLQQPAPKGGSIFKLEDLVKYGEAPKNVKRIVQSWDTGVKTGKGHDPSVCITFAETATGYYILDVFCDKLEYPELKKKAIRLAAQWNPDAIVIEDARSGSALIQDLIKETKLPVAAYTPKDNKEIRANAQATVVSSGRLFVPIYAKWLPEFELEFSMFPYSVHDDQVDALTQGLDWMRKTGYTRVRITTI